jgi:uncharacterized protein GlcG (DUF336 family)
MKTCAAFALPILAALGPQSFAQNIVQEPTISADAALEAAAGGVPIKSGNATIGAVGVSGTPSSAGGGEGDAKCAEAGIARIAKDLAPKS